MPPTDPSASLTLLNSADLSPENCLQTKPLDLVTYVKCINAISERRGISIDIVDQDKSTTFFPGAMRRNEDHSVSIFGNIGEADRPVIFEIVFGADVAQQQCKVYRYFVPSLLAAIVILQ